MNLDEEGPILVYMKQTFEELEQAVLALPDPEKSRLLDSLNEHFASRAVADAWNRLAITRLEGIRSGSRGSVDGPSGLKAMRDRVRG